MKITYKILFITIAVSMLLLSACEGPAGPEGPQGPQGVQGEAGQVGPAGEDGSIMYAGSGAPTGDVGNKGDYYLNSTTGEFYGPKDESGWGEPIIVLMGDDGQDGTKIHSGNGDPKTSVGRNGDFYLDLENLNLFGPKTNEGWGEPMDLDGKDGKDGSQIYSGKGEPDSSLGSVGDYYLDKNENNLYGPKTEDGWGEHIDLSGEDGKDGKDGRDGEDGKDGKDGKDGEDGEDGSQIYSGQGTPAASLGQPGDYYLDKSNYDLYGPKTNSGWGAPINIKGADGNANVTRYIFTGPDFSQQPFVGQIYLDNEEEVINSAWVVYLVKISQNSSHNTSTTRYYHMPGHGFGQAIYKTYHYWSDGQFGSAFFNVYPVPLDSSTEEYDRVEIIRIESSSTEDRRPKTSNSIIPEHLDLSNYQEVADYYGF